MESKEVKQKLLEMFGTQIKFIENNFNFRIYSHGH